MAKPRISFAWINFTMDFKTKEAANEYRIQNMGKGWNFGEISQFTDKPDAYGNMWTMEVRKPYRNYPNW